MKPPSRQKNERERKQMQKQQITTVTTFVPVVGEGELQRQLRKLGERDSDLATFARNGWELAHTVTITGPEVDLRGPQAVLQCGRHWWLSCWPLS
jgi:hypothetical protein